MSDDKPEGIVLHGDARLVFEIPIDCQQAGIPLSNMVIMVAMEVYVPVDVDKEAVETILKQLRLSPRIQKPQWKDLDVLRQAQAKAVGGLISVSGAPAMPAVQDVPEIAIQLLLTKSIVWQWVHGDRDVGHNNFEAELLTDEIQQ